MKNNNFNPLVNDFQYRLNKRFGKDRYTAVTYNGNEKEADIFCNNCKHSFKSVPHTMLKKGPAGECPFCVVNTKNMTREQLEYKISKAPNGNEYELLDFKGYSIGFTLLHKICKQSYETKGQYFFAKDHPKRCPNENCPSCKHRHTSYTTEEYRNIIKSVSNDKYELISNYINEKTEIILRHKVCGNEFPMLPRNFVYNANRCKCENVNRSKIEDYIAGQLEKLNISYKREVKFEECKDKRKLPFDFLINDNILLEFDGQQHFFPRRNDINSDYGNKFEKRIMHDQMKNKFCYENGYKLLRIPYTVKKGNIYKILKELRDKNFNLSSTTIEKYNLYYSDYNNRIKYYSCINENYTIL